MPDPALDLARRLMADFAVATGLDGGAPPRRYLWTDAFAVCNFLGLHRRTGEGRHLDLALRLVDQVHHVLGRHRPDDARRGWISGLPEADGERHPTLGGLRIGKPLPERRPGEAFDPRREWDRDGQYFHYLTQWTHALVRVHEETGQPVFRRWAVELMRTAQARFTARDGRGTARGMAWKMSIGLDRPLVPSMGQHDALDAWIADLELAARSPAGQDADGDPGAAAALARETEEAAALASAQRWETDDDLGVGGLALAAFRLTRRMAAGGVAGGELLARLASALRASLETWRPKARLAGPAATRLAFRELGLAIGLHAIERVGRDGALRAAAGGAFDALHEHLPLAARIDSFWSDPRHRQAASWHDHRDINDVMLATSLAPDGYLG